MEHETDGQLSTDHYVLEM